MEALEGWIYYVHVVDPDQINWAMRASEQEVDARVVQRHGFGLSRAGGLSVESHREQAATLAASERTWRLDCGLDRLRGICAMDSRLEAVEELFGFLDRTAKSGFPGSRSGDHGTHRSFMYFRGYADGTVMPAAAVATARFSGPSGRSRLTNRNKWLRRNKALDVLETDDGLWRDWESFGAAIQWACFRDYWISIEGYPRWGVAQRRQPLL